MSKILLDKFENNKKHKYIKIINPTSLNYTLNNYVHFTYLLEYSSFNLILSNFFISSVIKNVFLLSIIHISKIIF